MIINAGFLSCFHCNSALDAFWGNGCQWKVTRTLLSTPPPLPPLFLFPIVVAVVMLRSKSPCLSNTNALGGAPKTFMILEQRFRAMESPTHATQRPAKSFLAAAGVKCWMPHWRAASPHSHLLIASILHDAYGDVASQSSLQGIGKQMRGKEDEKE